MNEEKLDSDEVQKLQEGEIVEQAAGLFCSLPLSILGSISFCIVFMFNVSYRDTMHFYAILFRMSFLP